MIDTGWKEEMDKLVEYTRKNWWKTGNEKNPNACYGEIHVGQGVKKVKNEKHI
jgi:hypothetical protein